MEASTSRENEEDLKDIMDLIDIMDLKDITDLIHRVANCQIFYTEQIFQTKFYPKKSA